MRWPGSHRAVVSYGGHWLCRLSINSVCYCLIVQMMTQKLLRGPGLSRRLASGSTRIQTLGEPKLSSPLYIQTAQLHGRGRCRMGVQAWSLKVAGTSLAPQGKRRWVDLEVVWASSPLSRPSRG